MMSVSMSYFTIIGIVVASWMMLNQIGSEHQRLTAIRRHTSDEGANASLSSPPPAPNPPPAQAKTPTSPPAKKA